MPEPNTSDAASPVTPEDQVIRERVKGLTSRALQRGRIDPEAVKDIVRTVMGGTPDDVAGYRLSPAIRVVWIEDGDHSWKPRASSGRTLEQNMADALAAMRKFLAAL